MLENKVFFDALSTQKAFNFILIWFIAIVGIVLLCYAIYKIIQKVTFKYVVKIDKQIGDHTVNIEDTVREQKIGDDIYLRYEKVKATSRVFDPKYFRLFKIKLLGIFPVMKPGFYAYMKGRSVFPIAVSDNPGMTPVNIEFFDYVSKKAKYDSKRELKRDMLIMMSPVISIGVVIFSTIAGFMLYAGLIYFTIKAMIGAAG